MKKVFYRKRTGVKEIVFFDIPEGIEVIDEYAFSDYDSLREIQIPNSVYKIMRCGFFGCKSIEYFELPNSIVEIGEHAFGDCEYIYFIDIPASVQIIKDGFLAGTNVINIKIAHDNKRFSYNNGLFIDELNRKLLYCHPDVEEVEIPSRVKIIGKSSFYKCEKIKSINIPEGVESIEEWAFHCCTNLNSIHLPSSLKCIKKNAFWCTGIEKLFIPKNVELLSGINCGAKIKNITLDSENVYYKYDNDLLINIKNESIDACNPLVKKVWIPNYITQINEGAFSGCEDLNYVYIPNSVTYIDEEAFFECECENIYLDKENPDFECMFDEVETVPTIYVPIGSGYAYRNNEMFQDKFIMTMDVKEFRELFNSAES